MKLRYSRKHICEAIAYWNKQLRQMDESAASGEKLFQVVWKFSNADDNPEYKLYTSKEAARKHAEDLMKDDDDTTWYYIREYTVVQ